MNFFRTHREVSRVPCLSSVAEDQPWRWLKSPSQRELFCFFRSSVAALGDWSILFGGVGLLLFNSSYLLSVIPMLSGNASSFDSVRPLLSPVLELSPTPLPI
jgi:hypothetical protein